MSELRFEESEPYRAQRMTDEEARAVIDLWADRHRQEEETRGLPSVEDVASGLDIPPEEALRLLQEVRRREVVEQAIDLQNQQTTIVVPRRNLVAQIAAVAIAALVALFFFLLLMRSSVISRTEVMAPRPPVPTELAPPPTTTPAPPGLTPAPNPGTDHPAPAVSDSNVR